jgi:predicted transcriptional regulator
MMNDVPKPTDAELQILNLLWDMGPATVRQVHESLSKSKPSQYTTTLKLMQVMTDKGLLERDETQRSHVYKPRQKQEQMRRQFAKYVLDNVFGGSAASLLVGALGAKPASKKELAELQKLIADYRKGEKG